MREDPARDPPAPTRCCEGNQYVALARDRAQHAPLLVADGLANIDDALAQGILGDGNVVPDLGDDVVLVDEAPGVFGEEGRNTAKQRGRNSTCAPSVVRNSSAARSTICCGNRTCRWAFEKAHAHPRLPSYGLSPLWCIFSPVDRVRNKGDTELVGNRAPAILGTKRT